MDNRLFSGETLYCEGVFKPEYRGKLHLWSLLAFPYAVWHLYQGTGGFTYPFFIAFISLFGNFCCFGVSGLYHVFDWCLETEIILQKMDHIIISLWCSGMMFPIGFLLFPETEGHFFIGITLIAFMVNVYCIYNSTPSIIAASIVPSTILLYVSMCYKYMNKLEWILMWCVVAFQIAGTIIFLLKIDIWFISSELFGYHELFHSLSLFVAVFIYTINYSIAVRHKEDKKEVSVEQNETETEPETETETKTETETEPETETKTETI